VARGKGNIGAAPAALSFSIVGGFVRNPETGEVIEVGVMDELEKDDVPAELILQHPAREQEETKPDAYLRTMYAIGADGLWHTRSEAFDRCAEAGVGQSTFATAFGRGRFIEKRQDGKEVQWKLKS
jgi:hypothetical protein